MKAWKIAAIVGGAAALVNGIFWSALAAYTHFTLGRLELEDLDGDCSPEQGPIL